MIEILYELVEGRLNAVIHLTDWEDLSAKPDSATLWRLANKHNVPIAHDPDTASAFVDAWRARAVNATTAESIFSRRELAKRPLTGIDGNKPVLALIAHDAKKTEMCRFAVENAARIFRHFQYVLSTGTTGGLLREFMRGAGRSPDDIKKIRPCLSGPVGGDVQIAYAVIKGLCRTVIFFQDPDVFHPHDADIRLFMQAILASKTRVRLVTQPSGASLLLEPLSIGAKGAA
jgi:methylglyoxal synthase